MTIKANAFSLEEHICVYIYVIYIIYLTYIKRQRERDTENTRKNAKSLDVERC